LIWPVSLVLIGIAPGSLQGQVYSSSLTGIVTDPSRAVVSGAHVTLTDVGKQFDYNATTDNVGRYLLRSLPPSTYKLTVEAGGFSAFVQDRIALAVNQNATINVSLVVDANRSVIEVTAAAMAMLDTQDGTTGQGLDRMMINELPLLGRGVFDLANLAPGIHAPSGSIGGSNNFISNGSRNSTADVLMDGVSITSFEQNSGIVVPLFVPSVDSVQEFRIQQSNFSAEIGFSGATVVNMITRSGSNRFHGSAWEFVRNNILTANNWFANASGTQLAPRRYNLFGATVGGPIKKNRTFFFFSYEGLRDVNARTYTAGVPSAAMRRGDFSELCSAGFDAQGKCLGDGQLWDPYSGVYDPDAGGVVRSRFVPFNRMDSYQSPGNPKLSGTSFQPPAKPGNLIDPVAQKIMAFFPQPNIADQARSNRFYNWFGTGSDRSRTDQWDLKIDHGFNEANRISTKFSRETDDWQPANSFGNSLDPNALGGSPGTIHLFALNFTHIIDPKSILSLSYGYSRNYIESNDILNAYPDVDPVTTLGLPAYIKTSGFKSSPAILIADYYSAGASNSIGSIPWGILRRSPETHHATGSLGRIQGPHDLRIGTEFRAHRISYCQPGAPAGIYGFDMNGTSERPYVGGDSMASFLTGFGSWGYYEVPATVSTQSYQMAGYVQDNLKVRDRFTINIGLRYDLETPRTERYNRMSYIDVDSPSPLQAPGLLNLRGGLAFVDNKDRHNYGWDNNNFGPRFGFAYRLAEKTVVRGGYGLFYSTNTSGAAGTGGLGFQGFDRSTKWTTTYQNDGATPGALLHDPFPGGPLLPPGSSQGLMSYVGDAIRAPLRGMDATPYEETWSFGFQHELPGGIIIDANYVGKKGTKLYFGGASSLNTLGPEIEKYSPSQISDMLSFVPNPFYGRVPQDVPLGGPEIQKYQLMRPFPQFTEVDVIAFPVANSIYHAFQARAEKRFSHGLQFLATYTWAKSIDDASVTHTGVSWLGGSVSLQDPNNRRLERGLSQFDIPHILGISYVQELPFGRGRAVGNNWNHMLESFLGGWKTNGIWRFSSGQPIGLWLADGISLPTYGLQRPNLTGTLRRNTSSSFIDQYFANPEVVVAPEHYAQGTAPRTIGSVRSPGINNANLSLLKEFYLNKLKTGAYLEYRAEFFNAFNHPQFCGPSTGLHSWDFGQVQCTANTAREVQMALKLYW
jgi:hypothetical protein